jgi:hypothetical protein
MACHDERIFHHLTELLACLKAEYDKCDYDLCYLGIQSGEVADLTAAGVCGAMSWVRLSNMLPTAITTDGGQRCSVALTLEIQVGYATTYEIDEEGEPRTADEDLDLAQRVIDAQMLMFKAIMCCDWAGRNKRSVAIGNWAPLGPEGLVVGGTWTVNVDV